MFTQKKKNNKKKKTKPENTENWMKIESTVKKKNSN